MIKKLDNIIVMSWDNLSGYPDKNKRIIANGDIVEFYFNADYGYGDKNSGYTKMIDICWRDEKEDVFYFMSDIGLGAFIYRHNEHCEVIGNIFKDKDKHLIKDFNIKILNEMFTDEFPINKEK